MKIRFFGSSSCRDCLNIFVLIEKYQIDYEYIDGFDKKKEIQDFCDKHNIEKLPHLQFLDKNKVIFEHIGSISEEEFKTYLIKNFPNG